MALFIGVCYLANPFQSQISSIFHGISHVFEVPDTLIGHTAVDDKLHVAHHYHEHTHSGEEHEHTFVDFIDSIFNASDDGSQEESVLVDVKFDKHLGTDEYPVHNLNPIKKDFNFVFNKNNLINGHSRILEEPPQSFSL